MKRSYSCVDAVNEVPGPSPTHTDDGSGNYDKEDMGDYWTTSFGDDTETHQLFMRVKIVFGHNDDTVFHKHIDVAMSIKNVKDMIKRKKMHRLYADQPINLRITMPGLPCRMIGAAIRHVQNGDGSATEDADERYKMDDVTLKDAMALFQDGPLLVGHKLVDMDVNMPVVFHWSTVR